jgi:hypothetical protein
MNFHSSRDDMVRAARAVAKSQREMAALIGISHGRAVNYWINKLGLPKFGRYRHHSPETIEKIKSLFAGGTSIGRISTEMGLTRNQVAGVLDRANMFTHRERGKKKEKIRVRTRPFIVPGPKQFHAVKFKQRSAPVEPLHIPFLELERDHCRQPYGDDPSTMTFCGHPKTVGSYCAQHAAINYMPPQARNRNARPR